MLTYMLRVFKNIDFWPVGAAAPVQKMEILDLWIYTSDCDAVRTHQPNFCHKAVYQKLLRSDKWLRSYGHFVTFWPVKKMVKIPFFNFGALFLHKYEIFGLETFQIIVSDNLWHISVITCQKCHLSVLTVSPAGPWSRLPTQVNKTLSDHHKILHTTR